MANTKDYAMREMRTGTGLSLGHDYAANSKFEPMLGMLQSIKDNSESEEPVANYDQLVTVETTSEEEIDIAKLIVVVRGQLYD